MIPFNIFFESVQTRKEFEKNLIGAFRILFDLDSGDINSYQNSTDIHTPYSQKLGNRGYGINYDHREPINANVALTVYFPFRYKLKIYHVDLRLVGWSEMPSLEDFNKLARGKNIKPFGVRNGFCEPIDTDNSVFTATGSVVEVMDGDEIQIGSIEPSPDGKFPDNNYHQFLIRDGNMMNLAKRVKEIIDGRDRRKPTKPVHSPTPTTKTSPDLVGV